MSTQAAAPHRIPKIGFGDRLRRLRISLGMDQREFAAEVGLKPATLGNYELSEATPRSARLVANSIQLRYGIPSSWLLTGEEPADGPDGAGRQTTVIRPRHRIPRPRGAEYHPRMRIAS